MNDFVLAIIFGVIFFVIPVAIWFVHVDARRSKYKEIALDLGAKFNFQGIAASGVVEGVSNGRKYSVTNRAFTRWGWSGSGPTQYPAAMWTIIAVDCKNEGIPLMIYTGFLKAFPNWKYAFTRKDKNDDALVVCVYSRDYAVRLEERFRIKVQDLFRAVSLPECRFLDKAMLDIGGDRISFVIQGVFTNSEIIRDLIQLMCKIAGRIESSPVI